MPYGSVGKIWGHRMSRGRKALLCESVPSVWFIHVSALPPSLPFFLEHPLNALDELHAR